MRSRQQCPECRATDTERVHTEWYTDMIEETRICDQCDSQFTNSYDLFEQSVDEIEI